MPEKEIYHDHHIQVHQFHHPSSGGGGINVDTNGPLTNCVYPFHIPSAFVAFHAPPHFSSCIDHRAHENRFLWNPTNPASNPTFHPTLSHK